MHYRFFTSSVKAWQAMLVAIDSAHEHIYLEMYILADDTLGFDFLSALAKKASEGVRVHIVLDFIGSFSLANRAIEGLRESGAEVLFYSYWFKRTHRKILIIDEQQVFLGGVNISGKSALWRDLQIELRGKRIAQSMIASFALVYRDAGGKDPLISAHAKKPPILRRARYWFVEHGVGKKRSALHTYYIDHIDQASKSISLVTPYFIPHRWLVAHLHAALLRGVRVTITVPRHTDYWIIDRVNQHFLAQAHNLGAVCLISKAMNHAKAMLIDEKVGLVGSNNLDALSFDWNIEGGIFFDDKRMTARLGQIIHGWEYEAIPFERTQKPHWYDPLIVLFLGMFRSVL